MWCQLSNGFATIGPVRSGLGLCVHARLRCLHLLHRGVYHLARRRGHTRYRLVTVRCVCNACRAVRGLCGKIACFYVKHTALGYSKRDAGLCCSAPGACSDPT